MEKLNPKGTTIGAKWEEMNEGRLSTQEREKEDEEILASISKRSVDNSRRLRGVIANRRKDVLEECIGEIKSKRNDDWSEMGRNE